MYPFFLKLTEFKVFYRSDAIILGTCVCLNENYSRAAISINIYFYLHVPERMIEINPDHLKYVHDTTYCLLYRESVTRVVIT